MRTVPRVTIRPASTEAWEAHDSKEYAVTQDPHARIHREHPGLTEEAEITARFAAQMLGGTISHDPPPAGGIIAWLQDHPDVTTDDLRAEFARRGVDVDTYWVPGGATEDDMRRISGT